MRVNQEKEVVQESEGADVYSAIKGARAQQQESERIEKVKQGEKERGKKRKEEKMRKGASQGNRDAFSNLKFSHRCLVSQR